MRNPIFRLSLIAALGGWMTTATHADIVVWSQNFDSETPGPYGTTENYGTQPTNTIVAPGMGGAGQAMEITFPAIAPNNINFQAQTLQYPASGSNTNLLVKDYTLELDMQIQGGNPDFNMEISIEGPDGTTFGGHVSRWTVPAASLPTAGSGYLHISLAGSNSVPGNGGTALDPTAGTFRIAFGALAFPTALNNDPETIDVDNIQILMNTNAPPPPPPVVNIVKTTPALRVFEQNSGSVFTQEGFGTVDSNQSWLGSTPTNPTSYKINIATFPSVVNTTLHMQFVPVGVVNPFVVFSQTNAMEWRIRRTASGFFDQRIAWKTNAPNNGGLPNISLANTVSSNTNGIGTWSLTFTNDTDGYVTSPDGTSTAFTLPPEMVALFANPVELCIGTTPGSPAGFGEFFDFNRITLTNAATGSLSDDDFTKDDVLNTSLWNPAFSLDAGSVIQVSTNTPFWLNWTVPDDGFGLETKADLLNTTIPWYSLGFYGVANTPRKMGATLKWVLVDKANLPTVDGTPGGAPSTQGFFRLSNPPPSQ